jgi:uncharacterized membrane protein (UPF0127 family)
MELRKALPDRRRSLKFYVGCRSMNDAWARRIAAVAALCVAAWASAQEVPQKLAQTRLTAGIHVINAELATTPQQREIGLMMRPSMAVNDGMLFVFERPGQQCFWMKNTLIPLSIAFLADDGSVVNVDDMAPQTLDGHCSAKPVRFVLEMNQGWFAKHGIKPGFKLRGAPFAH